MNGNGDSLISYLAPGTYLSEADVVTITVRVRRQGEVAAAYSEYVVSLRDGDEMVKAYQNSCAMGLADALRAVIPEIRRKLAIARGGKFPRMIR